MKKLLLLTLVALNLIAAPVTSLTIDNKVYLEKHPLAVEYRTKDFGGQLDAADAYKDGVGVYVGTVNPDKKINAAALNTLATTYGEKCKELGLGLKDCVLYGDSSEVDKGLAGQLPDAEVVIEPEVPAYTMKNCLGAEIGNVTSDGYLVVDRPLLNTVIANGTYNGYTVSQVCTSNVTDMSYLFMPVSQGGTAPDGFNSDISNFDTSNVTTMQSMFAYASSFNQPVSFDTSNVTTMYGMFYGASSFNQPVNFNTSNVTTMNRMFNYASSFNQPLNFDTSKVIDMYGMFSKATSFNQPVNFDTSNVTNMYYMFYKATSFNQPVNFNTSNVTTMNRMFNYASSFNQPVNFDTSKVIDMYAMFNYASSFNQNISNWCVSKISSEPSYFSTSSPLTTANKPKWGTCP